MLGNTVHEYTGVIEGVGVPLGVGVGVGEALGTPPSMPNPKDPLWTLQAPPPYL